MKPCYRCNQPVSDDEMVSGLHEECFCRWFQVAAARAFEDVVVRSAEEADSEGDWVQVTNSFFHGKFRKYSARIGDQSYVLKVQQKDVPALPTTEYLCNQLAGALDLPVPDFYLIRFENELDAFVCRNFMEKRQGADLVHIYRYLAKPSHYDCEHLLRVIDKEVGRYEAVVGFVEICLFDSLIGNHDRHGRNLALIREPDQTTLAPFYDNPCYLAMEIPELLGAQHEPRGAIRTAETSEPTMKDYVKEWVRLGFREEVEAFAGRIEMENLERLVSKSFIEPKRKDAIWRLCQRRYKELGDAL